MTSAQKLKRLYILLRWYDCVSAASRPLNPPSEDVRLALELEKEMSELQKTLNAAKKVKKPTNKKNTRKNA